MLEPGCTLALCPQGLSSTICQTLVCCGWSQLLIDAPVSAHSGELGRPGQSQAWGLSEHSPGELLGLQAAPCGAGTCPSCLEKGRSPAHPPSYALSPPLLHCRGAFSYLRRVTEKSSRLDFAAKFVPGRTKAKQSARRELHILSQLDHERIVFFHDAFEKKNAVIIVMELYPPGPALRVCGVEDEGVLLEGMGGKSGCGGAGCPGGCRAWWHMEFLCSLTEAQLFQGRAAGQDGEEALSVRVRGE